MTGTLDKKKVVLGLSGGVDSTAAALILKEKGFNVIGLYFNVHKVENLSEDKGVMKAKKMAAELGIKLVVKDLSENFENCVIKNFIDEYSIGRTPNPCVICNPNIKFKTLIDIADEEGAFHIATGHYARTRYSEEQGSYVVVKSKNDRKDQSYMLYRLGSKTIERLLFPLENIEDKNETRKFVRENHLSNADEKDSQEICFVDGDGYEAYLKSRGLIFAEGDFVDHKGNILGKHKGIANYTIGQRKGLGIALGRPAFVTDIDNKTNRVTLGDNEALFSHKIFIEDCFFTSTNGSLPDEELLKKDLSAKIRYKSNLSKCRLEIDNNKVILVFDEAQRAAAPGQSAVIYLDDEVVGGGFISKLDNE